MRQPFSAEEAPYDVVRLRGNFLTALGASGITQRELAIASDVSVDAIRRSLVSNMADPQLSTLVKVAAALGMSAAQLVEGIDA